MVAVLVVLAMVGLWLAGATWRAVRRRRHDELRSTNAYRSRLDTLHVAPRDRGGSVRVLEDVAVLERPADAHATPTRPRLEGLPERLGAAPAPLGTDPQRRHGRSWALHRSSPRARIDTATMLIAAAVVFVVVVLGLIGLLIEHEHAGPANRAAPATARAYPVAPSRSRTNAQTIARSRQAS